MHVNAGERRGTDEDRQLLADEKMKKAQQMLNDNAYQDKKQEITNNVSGCMNQLIRQTKNSQRRATTIFYDMYRKLEIGILTC